MQVKEKPNGKLCICIDPSWTINKTIKRPKYRYMILTIEEKLPLLTSHHCYCIWSISHHCTGWKVLSTQDVSGAKWTLLFQQRAIQYCFWSGGKSAATTWILRQSTRCNSYHRWYLCVWVWRHKGKCRHRPWPKHGVALGKVCWTQSTALQKNFSSNPHFHGAQAYPYRGTAPILPILPP